MLGKLIKHEFKDTYKTFLMLYAAILFLSVMNCVLNAFADSSGLLRILEALFMVAFVMCAFFMSTISFVLIINRFYKNLLGDEGYLMHTLPVRKSGLIISKWIVAGVWTICSSFIVILSTFILISGEIPWSKMFRFLKGLYRGYDGMIVLTIVMFIAIIVSVMSQLMLVYASIAVGQVWQKHRILGAFIVFFAINMATQAITNKVTELFIVSNADTLNQSSVMGFFVTNNAEGVEQEAEVLSFADIMNNIINALKSLGDFVIGYMSLSAIMLAITCVVYYFICHYFMKNKLNLE